MTRWVSHKSVVTRRPATNRHASRRLLSKRHHGPTLHRRAVAGAESTGRSPVCVSRILTATPLRAVSHPRRSAGRRARFTTEAAVR